MKLLHTATHHTQVLAACLWGAALPAALAASLAAQDPDPGKAYDYKQEGDYIVLAVNENRGIPIKEFIKITEQITGKTFTFGSKGSTSGRLMPEFHIRRVFGKSPDEVFRRVGFSGDHSRTIALVQSGVFHVGAVNFKVWENEVKAGKIDPDRVRIIWKTPTYPDYQWTVRGDVNNTWGAGFLDRVREALLGMKDKELLEAFPRQRFVPARNSDYEPILETAKSIGLMDR